MRIVYASLSEVFYRSNSLEEGCAEHKNVSQPSLEISLTCNYEIKQLIMCTV